MEVVRARNTSVCLPVGGPADVAESLPPVGVTDRGSWTRRVLETGQIAGHPCLDCVFAPETEQGLRSHGSVVR